MRGKNGNMSGTRSVASELNMHVNNHFSEDPFIHGPAMFGNGSMLLSHTPPNITPGSYEISHMKRARAGSISGRLRSASDLEEKGLIDKTQKGVLKDLIINEDAELQIALDFYDQGDPSQLKAMMRNGLLDRRDSLDLLQDLDFGIMDLGMSDSEIPDLPEEDVNSVINDANVNHNISNDRDHCSDKFCDGNDTIEIVRRKDSGGGGGDFGQSGGGVKGAGGDGVSTAGGGTSAGGGKAAASSVSQPGARGECGGFEGLRRGRSSSRKGAALNSIENHDSGGRRSFGGLQTADAASGTAASTAPGKRGGVIASSCYSEQDIDLGAGSAHAHHQFDIGDMAFDAAFDYDGQEDDVDMREGTEEADPSSPLAKAHGATLGPTAVGPLRVMYPTQLAAAQARRSAQQHQQQQQERLASSTQDDDGRDHHEGPGAMNADGSPQHRVVGSTEGSPLSDHHRANGEDHHHQHDDDHHSSVGVVVEEDDEAAVLASYLDGGPTAPIGDFSPQFKFSFTDDIHLDLGSGLKDELADLDSLSEPLPDQQIGVKGGESYPPIAGLDGPGLAYRNYQHTQLLSRGGPIVKTEILTTSSSSDTASQTTVRLTSAARAAAAPPGGHRADVSAVMVRVGGDKNGEAASPSRGGAGGAGYYANNTDARVSSTSSSVTGRHTVHHHQYGTAASGGAGAAGQLPAGTPQGSVGVGGSGATGGLSGNGGRPHSGEVVSHSQQASPSGSGGAVRGRPVVSGMGVMVGGGPSPHHHHQRGGVGVGGGVDGEDRKFVGAYSPEARRQRIQRFLEKREHRVWTKMVKYDVRKNFADTRMRVKGRFVKKEDEALLREVMACA